MQNRFIDLIEEEKGRGKTILMSSHMFEEVERTCGRVGILREGRLAAVDGVAALKAPASAPIPLPCRRGGNGSVRRGGLSSAGEGRLPGHGSGAGKCEQLPCRPCPAGCNRAGKRGAGAGGCVPAVLREGGGR